MCEWLKQAVLKTAVPERVPGVRIPLPPPLLIECGATHLESMIEFLSILAVGFFLGMRHATDPDHVIAVTTIVSNQRNKARAALIGGFWGIGHTLTIFVVGTGIILFNLVIPVRVGLSMELSVAVMLIILGLMNISGFLRAVPAAPAEASDESVIVHSHAHSHGETTHSH